MRLGAQFRAADDLHAAVEMLDDGRAAFHPVAGVDVFDAVHVLDRGMVDVAADDAVDAVRRASSVSDLLEARR